MEQTNRPIQPDTSTTLRQFTKGFILIAILTVSLVSGIVLSGGRSPVAGSAAKAGIDATVEASMNERYQAQEERYRALYPEAWLQPVWSARYQAMEERYRALYPEVWLNAVWLERYRAMEERYRLLYPPGSE